MKQPVIDYRRFRPGDPQFSHLKLLWGWVVYFILFFLTENLIPAEACTPVHTWIDDRIPFCEWFLIPYVFWYGMIVFSLIYFALYNISSFRNLSTYIIVTQVVAMVIYILFPNRQDLRPEIFPRENWLTQGVAFLYSIDTNTGVCPSLHVAYSMGIASVWLKEQGVKWYWKAFVVFAVILICLSTMFIKQHSALDFFVALPVCALAEWFVFHYHPKRAKKTV